MRVHNLSVYSDKNEINILSTAPDFGRRRREQNHRIGSWREAF